MGTRPKFVSIIKCVSFVYFMNPVDVSAEPYLSIMICVKSHAENKISK